MSKRVFLKEINRKNSLISDVQYMKEGIHNYSRAVMFRGTPCILKDKYVKEKTKFKLFCHASLGERMEKIQTIMK